MKAITRLLLIVSAVALLTACASMDDRNSRASGHDVHFVHDAKYIATVESLAAARGVEVTWINPPRIRVEED